MSQCTVPPWLGVNFPDNYLCFSHMGAIGRYTDFALMRWWCKDSLMSHLTFAFFLFGNV